MPIIYSIESHEAMQQPEIEEAEHLHGSQPMSLTKSFSSYRKIKFKFHTKNNCCNSGNYEFLRLKMLKMGLKEVYR